MKVEIAGHADKDWLKVSTATVLTRISAPKARIWTDEELEELQKMRAEGKTYSELAKRFRCPESDIVNGLNRAQCRIYKQKS